MTTQPKVGLFVASYVIGTQQPGAPRFTVHLLVNAPTETVTGQGEITQAVNPPLNLQTRLQGSYTYMTVMPSNTHILVTATGYPIIDWPEHGGIGPVIPPNVDLRMVLTDDWRTGTANYRYMDAQGNWNSVNNVPVQLEAPDVLK